jgi:hypothetical protein
MRLTAVLCICQGRAGPGSENTTVSVYKGSKACLTRGQLVGQEVEEGR